LDDPLKLANAKAAAAYDAASDHFDDAPLSFWDRVGRRTAEGLALPSDGNVLDVGCGTGASALEFGQSQCVTTSFIVARHRPWSVAARLLLKFHVSQIGAWRQLKIVHIDFDQHGQCGPVFWCPDKSGGFQ
jgi:hypothetical protein